MGLTKPMALVAAVVTTGLVAAPDADGRKSLAIKYVHVGHVGKKGSGPGAFAGETAGVAVDQDCGDVFIADAEANRIQRFDQDGRFIGFIGQPGGGPGGIDDPHGIEVRNNSGARQSIDGPPPHCGTLSTISSTLMVTDWGNARVSFFTTTGDYKGAFCTRDVGGCTVTKSMSQANEAYDPSGGGFDPNPTDVEMDTNASKIWIAGASFGTGGGNIREYTADGAFIRESENLNYPTGPSSVAVSPAAGFLWATDDGKSQLVRYDLNPANTSLNRQSTIGQGYSNDPGRFGYVKGVDIGREGPYFDEVYGVESDRVQHFDETGKLRAVINLPTDFRGTHLDVRYDGTIYVTGTNSFGAEVYAPGPTVKLTAKALGGRKIRISGAIVPGHPKTFVRLERLEQGWTPIARKAAVNKRSRFSNTWKAPRKRTYLLRARFTDPHAYHSNRTSAIVAVDVR